MKCERCRKELSENERFCTSCGTKRPEESAPSLEETAPLQPQQKKGISRKFLASAGVAAAVIVMIIVFLALKKPVIDLNKYAFLSLNGSNGYAFASFYFDYEGLIQDYGNKLNVVNHSGMSDEDFKDLWGDEADTITLEVQLNELIECSLENNDNLSNGDRVTFVWDINEIQKGNFEQDFGCKVKYSNFTRQVTGLEEAEVIDPFAKEEFHIEFSGQAPNGEVSVNNTVYPDLIYEVTPSTNLSNGDKVTVTVSGSGSNSSEGFVFSETEKEYEVSGLDQYVTKASQIPEDYLEQMKKQAEDQMETEASSWTEVESYKGMKYIGNYLAVSKSGAGNKIYLIFKVNVNNSVVGKFSYYYYICFNDLIMYNDGTLYTDLLNYKVPDGYVLFSTVSGEAFLKGDGYYYKGYETKELLYNNLISSLKANYTVEENISEEK